LIALFFVPPHFTQESLIPENALAPLYLLTVEIIFHGPDKELCLRQMGALLI